MAYVRRRTTKAGAISTALVEAYRDGGGRPRQRLLANLHGEPDTLRALAKLAAQRDTLRKERDTLTADKVHADQFYEAVTQNTLHGHQYSADERKEIDKLMRQRTRLLDRLSIVERALAMIERDGSVVKKHCTSTNSEVQTAIREYKEELNRAEALVLGLEFAAAPLQEAKAKLRRLDRWADTRANAFRD
jgi:hypothetical protein